MTINPHLQFTEADAQAQEAILKQTIISAAKSPLYKKLWNTAHFKPENLQSVNDLNKVPYLPRKTLFETTRTKPNNTAIGHIGHWFLGHDNFETHEWYPYSNEDFLGIAPALTRLSSTVGLRSGDIVLFVVDTPPRISSFMPMLWNYVEESRQCGLEFINGSMEWYDSLGMSWITFIQKRRPTAIIATKTNAVALVEKLQALGTSVKAALPELRVGVFYGQGAPEELKEYASVETFEAYSPVEHMAFWSECKEHDGIHAWLDGCIPEILPEEGKEALLLSKAKAGTEGELVLTNFASALPLIRYRTGKHIRVESTGQCSCGANHPKIGFKPQ